MKKETVITCDYYEIEELIKETYNICYEIIAEEGCTNNFLDYTITGILEENDETLLRCVFNEEVDLKTEVNWYNPKTKVLMNDLCRRGLLEKGKYIIDVSY